MVMDVECPYCKVGLVRKPRSKSPCPKCGRRIVVRAAVPLYPQPLLTEEQAAEVDRYRHSTPATYGMGLGDFARAKTNLAGRLGRVPTVQEVIDAVNDLVPATDAQIAYARGVGLPVRAGATATELSRLLYEYEQNQQGDESRRVVIRIGLDETGQPFGAHPHGETPP
jgi:hypothetical protein